MFTTSTVYKMYNNGKKDKNYITREMKSKATRAKKDRINNSFVNAEKFYKTKG